MTHKVLILDDSNEDRNHVAEVVRSWDQEAEIVPTESPAEAQKAIENHFQEYKYAIVDLFDPSSPDDQQGIAFLDWLLTTNQLGLVPILVVSQHTHLINSLNPKIKRHVKTYKRTVSARDESRAIHNFIDGVIQKK